MGQTAAAIGLFLAIRALAIRALPVHAPAPAAKHALLLPTGTEYHVDMSRIRPRRLDADGSDRSARSDILLRQEPDEEEEEDDEEDEGNVTDDEGDDEEEDGGGYSMQVCHLCQW